MKRAQVIKAIRNTAKDKGVTMELVEGNNHTKVTFDGKAVTTVPRHNEVKENTARGAIKAAEDWEER